jgi:hypothetical protein
LVALLLASNLFPLVTSFYQSVSDPPAFDAAQCAGDFSVSLFAARAAELATTVPLLTIRPLR